MRDKDREHEFNNVVVFTVHKAGSMFVHRLTDYLTHQIKMPYYSPNKGNFPDVFRQLPDASLFEGKRGCFGPFRQYCPIDALGDCNIILVLRDPRDVLVSLFFMTTHKNPGLRRWLRNVVRAYPYPGIWKLRPRELLDMTILQIKRLSHFRLYRKLRAKRGDVLEGGIDRFVLDKADEYHQRYTDYCEKLFGRKNVTLMPYEDMVLNFDHWFSEFAAAFGSSTQAAIDESTMRRLRSKFQMQGEDRKSHKRKVTPGDHKEKLKPETIAALNEKFSRVLTALGYAN